MKKEKNHDFGKEAYVKDNASLKICTYLMYKEI